MAVAECLYVLVELALLSVQSSRWRGARWLGRWAHHRLAHRCAGCRAYEQAGVALGWGERWWDA